MPRDWSMPADPRVHEAEFRRLEQELSSVCRSLQRHSTTELAYVLLRVLPETSEVKAIVSGCTPGLHDFAMRSCIRDFALSSYRSEPTVIDPPEPGQQYAAACASCL